jgi:hypothetical protein
VVRQAITGNVEKSRLSTHQHFNEEAKILDTVSENTAGDHQETEETTESFTQYRPPFDLTSDMLLVMALCPSMPLRQTFPGLPFLSLLGKTPLLLWFSRTHEIYYYDQAGAQRRIGDPETVLYNELNVVAFLQKRALFIPGIYATSELTIQIGHSYGMPKQLTKMRVEVADKQFHANVRNDTPQSFVQAGLLGSGKGLARIISYFLPLWVWPTRFPSGRALRALIQTTSRVQIALVQAGQLVLETEWLPQAVSLLPVGLYLPGLRMQLPSPQDRIGSAGRYPEIEPLHSEQNSFQLPRSPLQIAMFLSAVLLSGAVVAWWLKKRPLR